MFQNFEPLCLLPLAGVVRNKKKYSLIRYLGFGDVLDLRY
jgi:hypothetical protein